MIYKKTAPFLFLLLGLLALASSCQESTQKADLIIVNANIWTGNDKQITAQSMAIVGDSIAAIGTNEEIQEFRGKATEVVDVKGGFITPGYIDSHVHLMTGGNGLLGVKLTDANTPEDFTKRIAEFAQSIEPGSWIVEGNWDHTLWGGELPKKEWIDEYTMENPVAVCRLDGHMLLANSKALEIAGIDKNTADVMGGEIIRNKDGVPTGILKDNAMNILHEKIPPMTEARREKVFRAAMGYFASNGVTSVHDVDGQNNNLESLSIANRLKESGELSVRIYAARPINEWKELAGVDRNDNKWLKRGCVKGFVDGSLGSHTAAFHEAYTDKANDKGLFVNSEEELYKWISEADKADLQLIVHAIGDRAIHSLLNIYERIVKENGIKDRRLRIEHAQHILPEDMKRFADLDVIASMQPYHAIDDGRWAEEVIGAERIKTTYAFKSLLDSKATVVFGSDWAVAPAVPLQGIYAAVTRRTLDDKNPDGWVPEQKIKVEEALIAYTRSAAYASFEEDIKGTLEPGKLADFVVISEDLTKVDPVKIKDLKVLQTYVGGKKVFERGKLATRTLTNPLIDEPGMSDPHAIVVDDVCYLFTGHDVGFGIEDWVMPDWRIYRSEDLQTWKHVGTISPEDNYMGKGNTSCWAGDIVERDGKYFWYFSNRKNSTGVMVASKPEGPYVDALGKPLVDSFDPSIFVDEDRTPYIIYGEHGYKIARLKDSMIELDEKPKDITINRTCHFPDTDKNSLHKHNGIYYLSCSGYYATSRNIYGPYETKGVVGKGWGLDTSYGHGDFFIWKGDWYHVWCKYRNRKYDRIRDCFIAPVIYGQDDSMKDDLSMLEDISQ